MQRLGDLVEAPSRHVWADSWQQRTSHLDRLAGELLARGVDRDQAVLAAFVPGRIEVLGKHTDYAGGRGLVSATQQGITLLAACREDDRVEIVDVGQGESVELTLEPVPELPDHRWSLYPMTVLRRLQHDFPEALRGASLAFQSDLPAAAGLASSSALVVAVFLALARLNDLYGLPHFKEAIRSCEELAAYLGAVESGREFGSFARDFGVGTSGGCQDHTAILCSRIGKVLQYRYLPTRLERTIELPDDLVFAVAVSGLRAEKSGRAREQYNRAADCAASLVEIWRQNTGGHERHLMEVLERSSESSVELRRMLEKRQRAGRSGGVLLHRLRHFQEECLEIVPAAANALAAGDIGAFGRIVDRSQSLAETLLGNQVPETVWLASEARRLGAMAASAFGAGYGGAVWALVERSAVSKFLSCWSRGYLERFPRRRWGAMFLWTVAAQAAMEM